MCTICIVYIYVYHVHAFCHCKCYKQIYSNSIAYRILYLPFQVISYSCSTLMLFSFLSFNHYVFCYCYILNLYSCCKIFTNLKFVSSRFMRIVSEVGKRNEIIIIILIIIIIVVCGNKTNAIWDFCLTNKMNLLLLYYA